MRYMKDYYLRKIVFLVILKICQDLRIRWNTIMVYLKEKNELGVFCLTSSSNNFEFILSLEYLASLYSLQTIFCFLSISQSNPIRIIGIENKLFFESKSSWFDACSKYSVLLDDGNAFTFVIITRDSIFLFSIFAFLKKVHFLQHYSIKRIVWKLDFNNNSIFKKIYVLSQWIKIIWYF